MMLWLADRRRFMKVKINGKAAFGAGAGLVAMAFYYRLCSQPPIDGSAIKWFPFRAGDPCRRSEPSLRRLLLL